jgi:hypothetical protein
LAWTDRQTNFKHFPPIFKRCITLSFRKGNKKKNRKERDKKKKINLKKEREEAEA